MKLIGSLDKQSDLHDWFFLPLYGMWKESSSTTELRTIFNGSSKLSSTNVLLNDLLY